MKIVRGGRIENSLQDKAKSNPYDVVMVYCRYCEKKIDVHVYHSFGKLEYYQIFNLPDKISKHLDTRNIQCNKCNKSMGIKTFKEVMGEKKYETKVIYLKNGKEKYYKKEKLTYPPCNCGTILNCRCPYLTKYSSFQ